MYVSGGRQIVYKICPHLDLKAIKMKNGSMTLLLSKAAATVHTQHSSILREEKLRSNAFGIINIFAIMRYFI